MSDSSDGFGCFGCIGSLILLSVTYYAITYIIEYWYVALIITVIILAIIIKSTSSEEYKKAEKERLRKEEVLKLQEDKEFARFFPDVEDKYNSVMSALEERKNSVYLEYVQDIYLKNRELFTKLKEIKVKAGEAKKLATDLERQLTGTQENNEKNKVSEKHYEKARLRFIEYKEYYEKIKETINGTAQDFLNVKGDLILGESDGIEQTNSTLLSLKAKSETINYMLNEMPNYD